MRKLANKSTSLNTNNHQVPLWKMFKRREQNFSYQPIVTSPTGQPDTGSALGTNSAIFTADTTGNPVHAMHYEHPPPATGTTSPLSFLSSLWAHFRAWISDYSPLGSLDNTYGISDGDAPGWITGLFKGDAAPCAPRKLGIHVSAVLFSCAWWIFMDGVAVVLASNQDGVGLPVVGIAAGGIKVEDWICGLVATLGMVMIQLVPKDILVGDGGGSGFYSYSSDSEPWKARLWFITGFVLMLGALGGSITVLVLKYTSQGYLDGMNVYLGAVYVTQSGLIFISSLVLWAVRNYEHDPLDGL